MQNLLAMNNFEMEEHQAELEKEQIKHAKVGEVLSNKPEIKELKKQMKNVGVDATKVLNHRFTQAGFKTADAGVSATQQTRSTGSDAIEPFVMHNSAQTMDESDILQDQMDESIALLNQAQQDNQQSAINQLTSSTNLAHQMVKGKGKEKGAYAMDAFQSTIYGGSSSSSGMQPMDQSIGQQKRSELGDTGGAETKKRGRKKRGDELVIAESGNGNGNGNGNGRKAKAKAKTKAEKREEKEAEQLTQPDTDKPTSKPSNVPVKKQGLKQKSDQVAPSVIGIQKLREESVNARNKGNLSNEDWSEYLKLYDDFLAAKGKPQIKKEKLQGLRALYKKSIYKK